MTAAADAAIDQACRILRLPTMRERYQDLAETARDLRRRLLESACRCTSASTC